MTDLIKLLEQVAREATALKTKLARIEAALDDASNVVMANTRDGDDGKLELDLTSGNLLSTLRDLDASLNRLD